VQRRQPPAILSQLLYLQQWKSKKDVVPNGIMPTSSSIWLIFQCFYSIHSIDSD
jgi:hypothetical protein